MKGHIKLTATGDALIMKRIPCNYPGYSDLCEFIQRGDARLTNLETTISNGKLFPSAYSGGTWLTTDERVLGDLLGMGFNMVCTANNHSLDYSYDGLHSTIDALERANVAYAGTGDSLFEASQATVLDTPKGRVGMIAICSSFNMAAVAGEQTPSQPGRPGLNPLRHSQYYTVTEDQLKQLREIAESMQLNAYHNVVVEQGFYTPDPADVFRFGDMLFKVADKPGKITKAKKADIDRTVRTIKDALRSMDYVVVMTHSHEIPGASETEAAMFLEEYAHACIDAGACAVIGGGTHLLKGIELYHGKPIFYSLGNFIFQNAYVKKLPADFMEPYGIPFDSTAPEAIAARASRATRSLQGNPAANQTVVPLIEMNDDKMVSLELLPVTLNPERDDFVKGWPSRADAKTAREITERLTEISARYGTQFELKEDGLIRVIL